MRAPVGYPDAMLIIYAKELHPGVLKRGLITGSNMTPTKLTTPIDMSISVPIKKGSKDGNTISNHMCTPCSDASKDCCGKSNIMHTSNETDMASIYAPAAFFILNLTSYKLYSFDS
jgi:hypothetical protein